MCFIQHFSIDHINLTLYSEKFRSNFNYVSVLFSLTHMGGVLKSSRSLPKILPYDQASDYF